MKLLRVLALAITAALSSAIPTIPADAATTTIRVTIDHRSVSTKVGEKFGFDTVISNDTDHPVPDLVAHLNIASTEPGTYVDPEDWSQNRTQYLLQIPAHETIRAHWDVRVVNDGTFAVYVAVTPRHGDAAGVVASDAVRLSASAVTPINPSGVLPVVIGTPLLVGGFLLGIRFTQRRKRLRVPASA